MIILLILSCAFGANAKQQHESVHRHPQTQVSIYHEIGIASWYNQGKVTYSEEPFNPQALTCAHNTLPMHSIVRITNLEDGSSVVCRVNDRGPHISGRIVDLSERAASLIHISEKGVARVTLRILKHGDNHRRPA